MLEEGVPVPFLQDLGVMTQDGKIVRAKSDKFRQINRFLEFIEDILPELDKGRELTILDFGCGKSYLTFAMYYYLHELKEYDIRIIGLDLKKEVIRHCNELSEKYGYENVGFHMGEEIITIDLSGMLTWQQVQEIEKKVNYYIWMNQQVNIFYPDERQRKFIPYRSKKELTGEIRLVEFPGADLCACCGLHVTHASQIGLVKITFLQKVPGWCPHGNAFRQTCFRLSVRQHRAKQPDCGQPFRKGE